MAKPNLGFVSRCQDPTELGSFMSALKCPDCESGYLLPIDSMDQESQWICSKCEHQQSSESVKKLKMCDAMRCVFSLSFLFNTSSTLGSRLH